MTDPVRSSRASARRLAKNAKRLGLLLFGAALGVFAVALVTDFTGPLAVGVVVLVVLGSVVLLPATIVGYGVNAAEREDRERGL